MLIDDGSNLVEQLQDGCYHRVADWKSSTGRKVIGCFPLGVPEEIVHAGGALPLAILGCHEQVAKTDEILPATLCPFIRTAFDDLLRKRLHFLDATIVPEVCDSLRCSSEIWARHSAVPVHHLMPPLHVNTESGRRYMIKVMRSLTSFVETVAGVAITDENLRSSIRTYNLNRSLMSQLFEGRRANPTRWSAREIAAITMASLILPKEEHNKILRHLLSRDEAASGRGEGVPLFVYGGFCDEPRWAILEILDRSRAIVVDDDLYVGGKVIGPPVGETGDPLEALADRYLNDRPCPTRHNPSVSLEDYLIGRVRQSSARGFLFLIPKFCDPLQHEYTHLSQRLESEGFPTLMLEYTEQESRLGQFETRLQAFVEMLE